jgi:hypothetical protein
VDSITVGEQDFFVQVDSIKPVSGLQTVLDSIIWLYVGHDNLQYINNWLESTGVWTLQILCGLKQQKHGDFAGGQSQSILDTYCIKAYISATSLLFFAFVKPD